MHSLVEHVFSAQSLAAPAGRAILACVIAFILTVVFAPRTIRALISLKIGQPIRSATEVHKLAELHGSKAGTPTMGGVLIAGAMLASTLLCARLNNPFVWGCILTTVLLGAVGFIDDYLKVTKKSSDGISARKKLLAQFMAALIGVGFLLLFPDSNDVRTSLHDYLTSLFVPFYGQITLSWFIYLPFGIAVIMACSNVVNLTDGLDGLAAGCSIPAGIGYAAIAIMCANWGISDQLNLPFYPSAGEIAVFAMALVGSCLGFLWFNCYPAKTFMGDTGSLALGGAFGAIAICTAQELLFIVVGGVFVMEGTSVLLQIGSYKLRHGKRIFAMAPIHHHFELKGWKETQVITRFWICSLLCALVGLTLLATA